jgi:hypothetical protein
MEDEYIKMIIKAINLIEIAKASVEAAKVD